jgi:hypothetical protein
MLHLASKTSAETISWLVPLGLCQQHVAAGSGYLLGGAQDRKRLLQVSCSALQQGPMAVSHGGEFSSCFGLFLAIPALFWF